MRLRPSGQSGPAGHHARRLPPLPGRGGLDLGAPGADPRPRRRRPGAARRRGRPPRSPRCSPRPHDADKVLADAADMRRRLAEAHETAAANPWEVKLGPGRMMDIELLAQAGALIHGPRRPPPARGQMLDRLGRARLARRAPTPPLLARALDRLATLQQIGRLASDHTIDPAEGGEGLVRLVLAATGEPDLDTPAPHPRRRRRPAPPVIADRLRRGRDAALRPIVFHPDYLGAAPPRPSRSRCRSTATSRDAWSPAASSRRDRRLPRPRPRSPAARAAAVHALAYVERVANQAPDPRRGAPDRPPEHRRRRAAAPSFPPPAPCSPPASRSSTASPATWPAARTTPAPRAAPASASSTTSPSPPRRSSTRAAPPAS